MFKRLVATSRAPQIMVLSMLRSFGKIGPQIDRIWAWLFRGHRWSAGVQNPLKVSVTGPSLLVNYYLEIKFHKIIRVNPPPLKVERSCEVEFLYQTVPRYNIWYQGIRIYLAILLYYFLDTFQMQIVRLYARYLCSRAHSAKRARDDRVSCI